MQLNWALVSGKQMEHDGTMETNIPHINPMSPRHTSLENLFSGSRIYQRKMEMDGRTFVVFFVHCFFSDGSGECHRCQDIFLLALSFSFWEQVTLCKKRIGASGIAGVPEVPMHVNVEAALTEFLTCQPWRCEHHFAQSWTAHFHGVNPSVQDNLTLRSRNLRQIGQRWPKCD